MALQYTFNPFTGNFDALSLVTIGSPANGLSITSAQVLSIALASTTLTGALSNTDWNTFNNKQPAGNYITALTGDGTATGPGSVALTLATVNANVGAFGSASSVAAFTVNAKGLTTAASAIPIQIAESQVTNLVSDLAGKQPTGNYITALTGDATAAGPGSVALTLATVNANIGAFGSASSVAAFTVNAKGLTTAASAIPIQITESQVTNLVSDLALKAPLASPALTGTPTAPTATAGTNTTQLATTAFVTTAVAGVTGFANTALSNLATTSINADLIPSANGTRTQGSTTLSWLRGYFNKLASSTGDQIDIVNRALQFDSSTVASWGNTTFTLAASKLLRFTNSAATQTLGLSAPTLTASTDYTLPPAPPTVTGYALTSTTAGVMSWAAQATPTLTTMTVTSSVKTPPTDASPTYLAMTGNSLTLTPGTWELDASCLFTQVGTAYSEMSLGFYGSNGLDTTAAPTTALASVTNLTVNSTPVMVGASSAIISLPAFSVNTQILNAGKFIVTVAGGNSVVYAVPECVVQTAANGRITVKFNAQRIY